MDIFEISLNYYHLTHRAPPERPPTFYPYIFASTAFTYLHNVTTMTNMHRAWRLLVPLLAVEVNSFSSRPSFSSFTNLPAKSLAMSTVSTDSWESLQSAASRTPVGSALDEESASRSAGTGAAFVQNKLRLFESSERPKLTLYRDHAGWYVHVFLFLLVFE